MRVDFSIHSHSRSLSPLHSFSNYLSLHVSIDRLNVPSPTFKEMFKEHAVAPFFVFQLFCVLLWTLDDYWYHSLFTLFMLFVFESTVVMQRLKNLNELRSMAMQPIDLQVYRCQQWIHLSSDALLPGDLVSRKWWHEKEHREREIERE